MVGVSWKLEAAELGDSHRDGVASMLLFAGVGCVLAIMAIVVGVANLA